MKIIRQFLIIFGCLAVGEIIVWLTGISIPSSIIGMLFLVALLQMKVVKVDWIKEISGFLISNIGFFFVPPGVALMLYFDLVKAEFWPIVIATVIKLRTGVCPKDGRRIVRNKFQNGLIVLKTRARELNGLVKAARKFNCHNLLLLTFDTKEQIEQNGEIIHILPATEWLANR